MKSYPIILVEWDDAAGRDRWHEVEEAEKQTPIRCVTVGLLLSKSPKRVVVASSHSYDNDNVVHTMAIPASCIVRTRRLGTLRPKK